MLKLLCELSSFLSQRDVVIYARACVDDWLLNFVVRQYEHPISPRHLNFQIAAFIPASAVFPSSAGV